MQISRAHTSRSHLALRWNQALWIVFRSNQLGEALGWSQALWIVFGSSQLGEGVLQEDFGLSI